MQNLLESFSTVLVMSILASNFMVIQAVPSFNKSPYGAINYKSDQIKNTFINAFYKSGKKENSLAHRFKDFLKNDEAMEKIKRIDRHGTSEVTLEVTIFKEDILCELNKKEDSLQKNREYLSWKQNGCYVLGAVGILGGALLINSVKEKEKVKVQHILGLCASGASVLLTAGIYYLIGNEEDLKEHMEEIHKMKKEWKTFFEHE